MAKIDMPAEKSKEVPEMPKQPTSLKKWKTQFILGNAVLGFISLISIAILLLINQQHAYSNSIKLMALRADLEELGRLVNVQCPRGFKIINGNCYLFSEEKFNSYEAKKFCNEKGARIFEPKDKSIADMVFNSARKSREDYWTRVVVDSNFFFRTEFEVICEKILQK